MFEGMTIDEDASKHLGHTIYHIHLLCPECGHSMYLSDTQHIFCSNNNYFYFDGDCDYYRSLNGLELAKLQALNIKLVNKCAKQPR